MTCWSDSSPVGCTSIRVTVTLSDMSDRLPLHSSRSMFCCIDSVNPKMTPPTSASPSCLSHRANASLAARHIISRVHALGVMHLLKGPPYPLSTLLSPPFSTGKSPTPHPLFWPPRSAITTTSHRLPSSLRKSRGTTIHRRSS
jgi:hypothetical protein